MKKISKICLCVLVFLCFCAPAVMAAGLVPCGGPDEPSCNFCFFLQMIENIIRFVVWNIALPIAVIAIIIGGVLILIHGGSPQRLETGKKVLQDAIIGLFIVFCAWLIINTFVRILAGEELLKILGHPWWNVQCK